MYHPDISRVDTNYSDQEYDLCSMPTIEDDFEDDFTWEDYDNE